MNRYRFFQAERRSFLQKIKASPLLGLGRAPQSGRSNRLRLESDAIIGISRLSRRLSAEVPKRSPPFGGRATASPFDATRASEILVRNLAGGPGSRSLPRIQKPETPPAFNKNSYSRPRYAWHHPPYPPSANACVVPCRDLQHGPIVGATTLFRKSRAFRIVSATNRALPPALAKVGDGDAISWLRYRKYWGRYQLLCLRWVHHNFVCQMAARRRLSLRESAQRLFSAQHLTASKGLVHDFS